MRALVVLAGMALLFSGCTGGSDTAANDDGTGTASTTKKTTSTQCVTNCGVSGGVDYDNDTKKPVFNPYHQHNLWAGRKEVWLFKDFQVILGEDVKKETYSSGNTWTSGRKCFKFADDGKYTADSSEGADVVFQGTKTIEYKISWQPSQPDPARSEYIPGLTFTYKPANSGQHNEIKALNGETGAIQIYEGMSDMAHSSQKSRWVFCLIALDETMQESAPARAMLAKGTALVTMKAIYGGKDSIDDPHPFYYVDVTERHVGEKNGTVTGNAARVHLDTVLEGQEQPVETDDARKLTFTTDAKKVIPWDTNTIKGYFSYNFTDDHPPGVKRKVLLQYSSSTGPELKDLGTAIKSTTDYPRGQLIKFELRLTGDDTILADDPYADESDWVWSMKPVIEGNENYGGTFTGPYHLKLMGEGDDTEVVQR